MYDINIRITEPDIAMSTRYDITIVWSRVYNAVLRYWQKKPVFIVNLFNLIYLND